MATDRNKKSLRTFQCRDYLWEYFEQMSAELECSVDYLVNEAMRQYARARVQASRGGAGTSKRPPSHQDFSSSSGSIPSIRTTGSGSFPGIAGSPLPGSLPPPPAGGSSPGVYSAHPSGRPTPIAPGAAPRAPRPPQAGQSMPPPLPGRPRPQSGEYSMSAPRPPLYLVFNGQKIPIDRDEFVIGRGAKHADLAIKDGNISRRHAAIVFQNGQYFMKDLGSTNGIEYGGQRIEARRIDDGDVFHLCDYELRFTYN